MLHVYSVQVTVTGVQAHVVLVSITETLLPLIKGTVPAVQANICTMDV